jgi:hypothetical protein
MELFSYKMTHDTGFAPNPFGHTLTLATCKPYMRKSKEKGQWIAGFTSVELNNDPVGEERLVYLMRVGEKLHMRGYFADSRFQNKIPNVNSVNPIERVGDNIYRPLVPGATDPSHFEQLINPHHWASDRPCQQHLADDILGQYVLIADLFYYFGSCPLSIPAEYRPRVPQGPAKEGYLTPAALAARFIRFIQENHKQGIHCDPTDWLGEQFLKEPSCAKKPGLPSTKC